MHDIPKEEILSWIIDLIREYPFYGNQGIQNAQKKIFNYLNSKWDKVYFDKFVYKDISNLDDTVDVKSYGSPYTNYEEIEKFNVYAVHDTLVEGPTLLLAGHIDVDIVDTNQEWIIKNGHNNPVIIDNKLYGRGSADMISGLVCQMLCASDIISKKAIKKGKVVFISVCDEEIGGNGTIRTLDFLTKYNIINSDNKNNLCIIAEPTELKTCSESLGFINFSIVFYGDSSHMGLINQRKTALFKFNQFYKNTDRFLKEILKEIVKRDDIIYKFNIGKITGGIDNAIPAQSIELNCTIFLQDNVDIDLFLSLFQTKISTVYEALLIKNPLSFAGANFTTKIPTFFKFQNLDIFPSPCDARLFQKKNIPTIIWGPGSLSQAHKTNEYINIDEIFSYYTALHHFITNSFCIL